MPDIRPESFLFLAATISGAISGAMFYIGGSACVENPVTMTQHVSNAAIHTVAGAASGAVNAAITGGDIGQAALIGGLSAGLAKGIGGANDLNMGGRMAIGAATGGVTSIMNGGDFFEGAFQGAWTSVIADICNDLMHDMWNRVRLRFDGETLKWTQNGEVKYEWPANSGGTEFNYDPIPEGNYRTWSIDFELKTSEEFVSWGPFSYRLHEGLVTIFRRWLSGHDGGFHIHGGTRPGTAGCIEFRDYSESQTYLHNFHNLMQAYKKPVYLIVNYK
jgi:hypothetical protein